MTPPDKKDQIKKTPEELAAEEAAKAAAAAEAEQERAQAVEEVTAEAEAKLKQAEGASVADLPSGATPAEAAPEAPAQTILAAGHVHEVAKDAVEKISEEIAQKDLQTIAEASIEEVRYNTKLLTKDKEDTTDKQHAQNIKEESYRRIKSYATHQEDGWFKLDYAKIDALGSSSKRGGLSHEMNVGLGDILLDSDINRILVERTNKDTGQPEKIIAKRGIVSSGRHRGRVAFIDEQTGDYVWTHTGDKFKIISNNETNLDDEQALAKYMNGDPSTGMLGYNAEQAQRATDREEFKQDVEFRNKMGGEIILQPTIDDYINKRTEIEKKLNPSEISKIPETERVEVVPRKPEDSKRMVIFGDTNGAYGSEGQKYLSALQSQIPEWDADFVLGMGDFTSAGSSKVSDEQYQALNKKVKEEFSKFQTPLALALGNHDKNPNGTTDDLRDAYKERLVKEFNYEETEDKSAYSYKLGNATFVVFNSGDSEITDTQVSFFQEQSAKAEGAIYLVNHVPPFQHAYGSGLSKDGTDSVSNFDKIQAIAKTNVEDKGQPFYILGGHDHFHTVIGNFLNPGGMGSAYNGLDGMLKSKPSAAIVDMDANGKITAVYFRSAESGFKDPLPELQHALAWGKKDQLSSIAEKERQKYTQDTYDLHLDPSKSVVEQIKENLSQAQREMATIIEEEFKAAGVDPGIIAAAIVNANQESGLNPKLQSKCTPPPGKWSFNGKEDSWGLFQINVGAITGKIKDPDARAAAAESLRAEMQDPRKNCQKMLHLLRIRGSRIRAAAAAGASVPTLTGMFSLQVELAGGEERTARKREKVAAGYFYAYKNPEAPKEVVAESGEVSPEQKFNPREIAIIGDSFAQGQWLAGLSGIIPKTRYMAKDSTRTEHYIAMIKGGRDIGKLDQYNNPREKFLATIKGAKMIYLKLGGNEYWKGLAPFKRDITELIGLIRAENPSAAIVVPELSPLRQEKKQELGEEKFADLQNKKEEINTWIRSGGNGLFRPLIWADTVASSEDPQVLAQRFTRKKASDGHLNTNGFKKFNARFLEDLVST